jgi:hypothetical protein
MEAASARDIEPLYFKKVLSFSLTVHEDHFSPFWARSLDSTASPSAFTSPIISFNVLLFSDTLISQ